MTDYDLSGRVSLRVTGGDERVLAAVTHQMDPCAASPPTGPADVILEFDPDVPTRFVDVQNPARDGLTTGWDGRALSLVVRGRTCTLLRSPDTEDLTLRCHPAFPIGSLFRTVVRPALQTAAVRRDTVAVHSAAVEIDGRAVLVAGWSESGKTETALALMEDGARWVSDKWTLLGADGVASAFPINVGVRRWVLPYLPQLAAGLPRASRAQVAIAGAGARATSPLRRQAARGGRVGTAAALAERAVAVVDRAALTPGEIRAAYGQEDDAMRRVPLGTVALLSTVPGPGISVEDADPEWAAARLALTGAYERHDWYLLEDRERYADPARPGGGRERAVLAERRVLEKALDGARVLRVQAPFPVDPRLVARAVHDAL